MAKKLSVIIVAYKKRKIIDDCLESVFKYNDIGNDLEVIVVDNSPQKDNLYYYIKEKYKEVKIKFNDNKGFGEANNRGAEIAEGKYLLFLNPDTILVEPIFEFAIKKFEENEKLALFGLKLISPNGEKRMSYVYQTNYYGLFYVLINRICNKLGLFNSKKMAISGADIFIRKDIFEKIGMFDENIFMYCEEADITKRILKNYPNFEIKYFKDKKIIHLEGKTQEASENSLKNRLISNIYMGKKYNFNPYKKIKFEFKYLKFKLVIFRIINKEKYVKLKKLKKVYLEFIDTMDSNNEIYIS